MSDPHCQATSSSVSLLLESLLGDVDDVDVVVTGTRNKQDQPCYHSSTLDNYLSPDETDARWADWDDVMDFGTTTTTYTQSEVSEVTMRRKRKRAESELHVNSNGGSRSPGEGGSTELQQRQRGKNWEKAEEDILVECKSRNLDWKAVSEQLQEQGFTRNHKHCADKWYALRKHYLEVHQWMAEHPGVEYWDRTSCSDRIRSVPPSFCQKWYQIFDAAENREGRKSTKMQVPLNQRRKVLESAGAVMDSQESLGFPAAGDRDRELLRLCTGDAAATPLKEECCEDAPHAQGAMLGKRMQPNWNMIEELVTEIQNLRQLLTWRFEAEEKERSRNLAIQEKKLELKRHRFEYQRRRDGELR